MDIIQKSALADVVKDHRMLASVYLVLQQAIKVSYKDDIIARTIIVPVERVVTEDETKRRFKICVDWINRAIYDFKYSLEHALDLVPGALRSALDGQVFQADGEDTWASYWKPEDC